MPLPPPAFQVLAKPAGPACNLDCRYCFYLGKASLWPAPHVSRMADDVLEAYVRRHIAAQRVPEVTFAWQGGEPTLCGLDFFRKVVALQARHAPEGMRVVNTLQTNGLLLDAAWARFLRRHGFLVGLSLDGPAPLHDALRVDRAGRGSHAGAVRALRLLQDERVEHNVLCVVHRDNAAHPGELWDFFRREGVEQLQWIPLVEPAPGGATPESVSAAAWGAFLCASWGAWIARDVGRIYVQLFETAFRVALGMPAGVCIFEPTCGLVPVVEHDGGVYACDHYVTPEWRLGDVRDGPLEALLASDLQRRFGEAKLDALPGVCRRCDVRAYCNGECPKNRLLTTADGEPGLNWLCAGYQRFFRHARPGLTWMARAWGRGIPPAAVMEARRRGEV